MLRPPLLRSRRRAASLSEHRAPARARMHPPAARFAPRAARLTCPAPASPSIARHPAPLSEHRAPARSRLHSLASRFQARYARFTFRETSDLFAWNIRVLVGYSVFLAASKTPDLVTNLVNSNFLYRAAENTKAAEVAAGECFRLAGPTGLEPATSGVTGRGANGANSSRSRGSCRTFATKAKSLTTEVSREIRGLADLGAIRAGAASIHSPASTRPAACS